MYLLKPHLNGAHDADAADHAMHLAQGNHVLARLQRRFESELRNRARELSQSSGAGAQPPAAVRHRISGVVAVSFVLVPFLGSNFFPSVDTGQITLACAPAGRHPASKTPPSIFADIEDEVRRVIPAPRNRPPSSTISACRSSSINLIYNNTGVIGTQRHRYLHQPEAETIVHRRLCEAAARRSCRALFPARPSPSRPPTSSARF